MLTIFFSNARPGPGWHRHGTTEKMLWILQDARLTLVVLHKQRWLHVASGTTRHDRPAWDSPHSRYGLDVVIAVLGAWLFAVAGLHTVDWPWEQPRPARRTAQRWAAALAPLADRWLRASRQRILDHVAPRPLEELLPAGGIPPPRGARSRCQGVAPASKLRDVIWLHENVARALCISIRQLLVVARWRWTNKPAHHRAS